MRVHVERPERDHQEYQDVIAYNSRGLEGAREVTVEAARARRLNRIFRKDGRTVIVAMDGAPTTGPVAGMANPGAVLLDVVEGGADAVLMTYGLIQRFGPVVHDLGIILRCDGAVSSVEDTGAFRRPFGATDALRLAADAVACNAFPHAAQEQVSLDYLANLVSEAAPWNLPVLAESIPGGFEAGLEHRTPDAIAFAARAASELGPDFVKTVYTGSRDTFATVVEQSYLPVVVLGGAPNDPRTLFENIANALEAGASGVAVGRNIWHYPHPARITRAVVSLVHGGSTVDQAMELLSQKVAVGV
jgi:DhnA family fructose-bisphosphate aldolase class Ia